MEQLAAIGSVLPRWLVALEEATARFTKADVELVARHVERLVLLGQAMLRGAGDMGGRL
jgi:hypothetical protein